MWYSSILIGRFKKCGTKILNPLKRLNYFLYIRLCDWLFALGSVSVSERRIALLRQTFFLKPSQVNNKPCFSSLICGITIGIYCYYYSKSSAAQRNVEVNFTGKQKFFWPDSLGRKINSSQILSQIWKHWLKNDAF